MSGNIPYTVVLVKTENNYKIVIIEPIGSERSVYVINEKQWEQCKFSNRLKIGINTVFDNDLVIELKNFLSNY